MFENRNIFDFKAVDNIDGRYHLSFIEQHQWQDDGTDKGRGFIFNEHYEVEHTSPVTNDLTAFNMHEFNVLDGGKTALACAYRAQLTPLEDLGRPDETVWVQNGGFVELDTETGNVLVDWNSPGRIFMTESVTLNQWDRPIDYPGWDYIHVNSVDKNGAGDYLLSARFTNTIYLISGVDGRITWRLGGKYTDFEQDFTFSKQHHARFVESNATHHTISFLNNASDERSEDEEVSSALYVRLDTSASPMVARVIKRFYRPDGGLTRLRGNVQTLPNGNTFVGWSEGGYQSESSADGKLLMEASFASNRFSSYRSYKFPFHGRPNTPPDLVASVYGTDDTNFVTVFYVSWNGATDVASWNFYARQDGRSILVGNTTKTDFETLYVASGYLHWVSAEAVDKDGQILGVSNVHRTIVPDNWEAAGFRDRNEKPVVNSPQGLPNVKNLQDEEGEEGGRNYEENQRANENYDDPGIHADDVVAASSMEKEQVAHRTHRGGDEVIRGVGSLLILVLSLCSICGILAGLYMLILRRCMQAYSQVPLEEAGISDSN